MKKVFAVAALALLSFASCKKDYICECTTSNGSSSVVSKEDIKDQTKKDAKTACENKSTTVAGITKVCKIK